MLSGKRFFLMKLNQDIQAISLACNRLDDESKRLSSVLNDYEVLVEIIRRLSGESSSKLSKDILHVLDKFGEL
jgi:hypothetical protein